MIKDRYNQLVRLCSYYLLMLSILLSVCTFVNAQTQVSTVSIPPDPAPPVAKQPKISKKRERGSLGKNSTKTMLFGNSSFRIIVPTLVWPKVEGFYDYAYKVDMPPDMLIEASLEPGRAPLAPEKYRNIARQKWKEAEVLRAEGTAQSLRTAMMRFEDAWRYWRAAGMS